MIAASKRPVFPKLSHAERDRRYRIARDLLEQERLDALLLFGDERHAIDNWFTNDRPGMAVIFPLKGEMTCLAWSTQVIGVHMQSAARGEDSWATDLRRGAVSPVIVDVIKEKGLAKAKIGVVGVGGGGSIEPEGRVPYRTWRGILDGLPDASFRDVDTLLYPVVLAKSDEELELVKRCAEIGELACEAMIEVTRVGVSELEIYATLMDTMLRNGARSTWLILQSGSHNSGWGPPQWFHRSQEPYVVQRGDMVMAELFPHVGMIETQQQMSICVGEMADDQKRLEQICIQAHDDGLEVLRRKDPTLGDIVNAMEAPVKAAGAWSLTPMVHPVNPVWYGGNVALGIEEHLPGSENYKNVRGMPMRHPDLVLRPGMTFAVQPNAQFGNRRVNLGGAVVMTDGEPLVLNSLCNRVACVPG